MVRNPYRLLTRMPWTVKNISPKMLNPYLASIGRCELALGMGAPIGQYVGQKLATLSSRHVTTDLEYVAKQQNYRPRRAHLVPSSDDARNSYAEAWNISPDLQKVLENVEISMHVDVPFLEERPYDQ